MTTWRKYYSRQVPSFSCYREHSSSPETCNDRVCITTSPGEMTSVRTCYCKHEEAARKKDNDIRIHNGNRRPATVISKKSIVASKTWSPCETKKARRVANEETLQPSTSRSVETEPPNLVLSPETSAALENAEKIINNAKMQLIEVCATSSFDSARRNRNTYLDEPPLDDETEERLYVRQLVASKFHDACSSRLSEVANGDRASTSSGKRDFPRVSVRRVDLSAPKFRVSCRRRADWSSLGYGGDVRSRGGRASPTRVPSRDLIANEITTTTATTATATTTTTTARDEQQREENTCRIQIGPSVHIVDRELTRQDLEDVHISPEPIRAQSRANTATYTLRHEAIQTADNRANVPSEVSGTPRTRSVRLDTISSPRGKPIIVEAAPTVSPAGKDPENVGNSDFGQVDGPAESPRVRNYRRERKARELDPQNAVESPTNRGGAVKFTVIETPRSDRNGKSRNKARDEGSADRNGEDIVGKIQMVEKENRGDRSGLSFAGDTSRKAGFPRRESSRFPRRTIDGHLSYTFNSHNGQDGSRDVVDDEDNLVEIELYRPRLGDVDSILHTNDRKIERVVRATRNLSELLAGPEFAVYKLDEGDADREKLGENASADKDREYPFAVSGESGGSSIPETEPRNENLTVSETRQTDEDPRGGNATEARSSTRTRENAGSRSVYSGSSVESSSVFPESGASDRSPRTSRDKAERSDSLSLDRSDVTTFSNLAPVLSSTRTDTTQTSRRPRRREGKVARENEVRSGKKYTDDGDDAFARKGTSQDRFVAYLLQDEKRSVEGKIASALKRAITPATVQKLLDHLREAETIRDDAHQTETLDILRNFLIGSQSDNANDKKTSSRNVPDSLEGRGNRAPTGAIIGLTSREENARQGKIDADGVVKESYELRGLGEYSSDFSECRATRDSVRTTARCESAQESNNEKDAGRGEGANAAKCVAGTTVVPIDAKDQTDKGVNEDNRDREETSSRNAKDDTNDAGQIIDESNDLGNPDKYFSVSPAIPEARESARSATHPEAARGSRDNSKDNSKGNTCSETESLKQIPDIRSDDDGKNLEENSEHLSTKIAFAEAKGECKVEATELIAENKEDHINIEKPEEDKSRDAQANKDQASKTVTNKIDNVPKEVIKKITVSEKAHDRIAPANERILFASSEVSGMRGERICTDASLVGPRYVDENLTKSDVGLVQSSAKEDAESSRGIKINPEHAVAEQRISSADNRLADPPRNCVMLSAKNGESRSKQISFDVAGEADSTGNTRNEEIRKPMTFLAEENRRDGNEISESRKTARSDDGRQPMDSTDTTRKSKINVLSSSNSSISSMLLDHDDRSINGMLSANVRKVGTTSETSHSEGELYMPSSCSYSLGEVRVLRRKRDLIEDNAVDRDSSATVLVTRSMLTSLNDSTISLLESSGRV